MGNLEEVGYYRTFVLEASRDAVFAPYDAISTSRAK